MSALSIQRLARSMSLARRFSISGNLLRAAPTPARPRSLRADARTTISRNTIDLAFVTQGDVRPILDNQDASFSALGVHTYSEIYQKRAADLPKVFDRLGPDDIYPRAAKTKVRIESIFDLFDAEKAVNDLPTELRLRNVFFLGHGSANHGFLFSGNPSGPGVLDALVPDSSDNTLHLSLADAADSAFVDGNTRFLEAIRARLASGYCGIWFLSCFTGLSELPTAIAAFFKRTGRREFFVGAYENFYQVNVRGRFRGTTAHTATINGTTETFSVRRLGRFVGWQDRILDGSLHVVGSSARDSAPRFEVLDGHGQLPFEHPEVLHRTEP